MAKILKSKGADTIHFCTCTFARREDGKWVAGGGFCDHVDTILQRISSEADCMRQGDGPIAGGVSAPGIRVSLVGGQSMSDEFETFAQNLQANIFEETKEDWGEKAYERLRNPLYMGVMHDADGEASLRGRCGDQMQIFLKFDGERVAEASFFTDGCGPSLVCGSFAAEMARGKAPEELFEISGEIILSAVGGLPQDHDHCAFLAAETLQAAANDYLIRTRRGLNHDT
jgi:NifU-like protein involved in Fe-S cluster formation